MHLRHLFALLSTALAADDGGALTPPRGWRSWNQFNGAVTHDDIVRAIHGLTDRSRLVDGVPTSLADLGYGDVGIDDGWQQCGHYGPHSYRYHDAAGRPVVANAAWPRLPVPPVGVLGVLAEAASTALLRRRVRRVAVGRLWAPGSPGGIVHVYGDC